MNFKPWVTSALFVCATAASAIELASPLGTSPQAFQGSWGGVSGLPGEPFFETVLFSLTQSGQSVVGTFSGVEGDIALDRVYIEPNRVLTIAGASALGSSASFSATVVPVKTATGYSFTFDQVPAYTGTYILGLRGSFGAQGASGFKGTLASAAAVPEASNWAMWALGLAGMASLRRARRAQ